MVHSLKKAGSSRVLWMGRFSKGFYLETSLKHKVLKERQTIFEFWMKPIRKLLLQKYRKWILLSIINQ